MYILPYFHVHLRGGDSESGFQCGLDDFPLGFFLLQLMNFVCCVLLGAALVLVKIHVSGVESRFRRTSTYSAASLPEHSPLAKQSAYHSARFTNIYKVERSPSCECSETSITLHIQLPTDSPSHLPHLITPKSHHVSPSILHLRGLWLCQL